MKFSKIHPNVILEEAKLIDDFVIIGFHKQEDYSETSIAANALILD